MLAFELAIHPAFGKTLAIVGMSLNDTYLRDQIELVRGRVGRIYWFDGGFREELAAWAARNEITMVPVDWREFWAHWLTLGVEHERTELWAAWYLAVEHLADAGLAAGETGVAPTIRGQGPRSVELAVRQPLPEIQTHALRPDA